MAINRIGSNFLWKPVRRLSQLTIDYDKDWVNRSIVNLKEMDTGMIRGDLLHHDGTRLVLLRPGRIGTVLMAQGVGNSLVWRALYA